MPTLTGLSTNFFPTPKEGFTTTTSSSIASGAATVPLNSTTGYTNGDVSAWVVDPAEAAKKQVFTGTVNTASNQIENVVWTEGTNQAHAAGATVVDYVTATHMAMVTKGIKIQHKVDGTHANTITTDTINENTSGNGVTVDGLNIKDSKLNTNNSVVTANVTNGAITAAKQTATYYQANVSGSGGTTSLTHVNFPTNRCKVDVVTANANAIIEVTYSGEVAYASATGSGYLQFTLSGANTGTSTYERRAHNSDSSQRVSIGYSETKTLATAGTTTVEMQLRGSAGASTVAENVVLTVKVLQDKG